MYPMTPDLVFDSQPRSPAGVVLVLHGGREHSEAPTSAHQLAVLRMVPVATAIVRASAGSLVVARLRFTARGWNGDGAGPLADAQWALEQLTDRFPDVPVGIVGHSMGGRVALLIAGHPRVRIAVGLAPWLPAQEPVPDLAGARVVLVHGNRDRTTSATASARMVAALRDRGAPAGFVQVNRAGHAMLCRARLWHDLSSGLVCGSIVRDWPATDPAAALLQGAATVTL